MDASLNSIASLTLSTNCAAYFPKVWVCRPSFASRGTLTVPSALLITPSCAYDGFAKTGYSTRKSNTLSSRPLFAYGSALVMATISRPIIFNCARMFCSRFWAKLVAMSFRDLSMAVRFFSRFESGGALLFVGSGEVVDGRRRRVFAKPGGPGDGECAIARGFDEEASEFCSRQNVSFD
jgi:hypothetical protein